MDGIEFIEYATASRRTFGDLLQRMASRRSRATARASVLYRRAPMN